MSLSASSEADAFDRLAEELALLREAGVRDPKLEEIARRHELGEDLVRDYWRALEALEPTAFAQLDAPFALPSTLGSYEVRGVLGRGGMGVVLRGYDPTLGREVAIKTVRCDRASERATQRFQREVQALASLRHPNVVRAFGAGELPGGQRYVVMERVEGEDLASRLAARGSLSEDETLVIGLGLARALEAVHAAGFLHRDLKPSNVILRPDGTPVLLDFGLVRFSAETQNEPLTEQGRMLGSQGFRPPEQTLGQLEDMGPPSDLYGLGATLVTCLAGRPPGDLATSLCLDEVGARDDLSPGWLDLLTRCLDFEVALRPQSATEVRLALEKLRGEEGRREVEPRALSHIAAAACGLAVAALVLAGALWSTHQQSSPPPLPSAQASVATATRAPEANPRQGKDPIQVLARKARAAIARGDLVKALALTDEARALAPNAPSVLRDRARILLDLGRPKEALPELDRALELQPDHALTLVLRSNARRLNNARQAALEDALAAVEADGLLWSAHLALGTALQWLGKPEPALASFDEALRLSPGAREIYERRAACYVTLGRLTEARADVRELCVLLPRRAPLWVSRANIELSLNLYPEAVESATRALTLGDDHDAYDLRAEAHRLSGANDLALKDARAALRSRPDCDRAKRTLALAEEGARK